ncbi:hypothetical protein B0J18DRAFT_176718 [Chaetomium sp. MPI-SDFR-AT-0129]|nr:hypothetical protein B0J18DRAFT_176718 [Chaetomium sp. MPI-SDFR-AT-0129]
MASASVTSGTSPLSGFEFEFPQHPDGTGDPDEGVWTTISNPSTGSMGLLSSPANSLGSSWVVMGDGQLVELQPSPAALGSPLSGQMSPYSATLDQTGNGAQFEDVNLFQGMGGQGLGFMTSAQGPPDLVLDQFGSESGDFDAVFNPFSSASILEDSPPRQQQQRTAIGFPNPQANVGISTWDYVNTWANQDVTASAAPVHHPREYTTQQHTAQYTVQQINHPRPPPSESSHVFVMEDPSFVSRSPSHHSHHTYSPSLQSASASPPATASPRSPTQIKFEPGLPDRRRSPAVSTAATSAPKPIPTTRKLNTGNRVQKRKAQTSAPNPSPTSASGSASTSASSAASKFLIVTPSSISHNSSTQPNLNPFECLDALSRGPTQRGRKGPLATDTKQSALVVRRMGACFSCHARKVRCDKERPCRNCVRLAGSVPQVVCWQFGDFTPVLFPGFIRGHLRREEVAKFVEGSVESFRVGGVEVPCTVELVSGVGFGAKTVLEIKAKFFTARTADVLQHWHAQLGRNGMDLASRGAAPIGLEMGSSSSSDGSGKESSSSGSGSDGQKAELKRRVREYVQAMVDEPHFAELVTPAPQHTDLPRRVLRIVHDYAMRCDVPMVRRALSIYAMHFVMTRHLCLTAKNVVDLCPTGLVPQGVPWVTPRVLNRQIKAVVDEMLCREMQLLFDNFSKSLKPKLRREWAPCLASFLVLCLFMESVETAADLFVISDNQINLMHQYAPAWQRSFVLGVNREIENMPFKQFAFQFHQIYQTHSRDAAARSFNPIVDDTCFELGELENEAAAMVRKLRRFIDDDWSELDYLTADPILPSGEDLHPRNMSYNYTGRLVAKFLLSFTDERYIFDGKGL